MSKYSEGKLGRCPVLIKNIEAFSSSTSNLIPLESEFKEVDKEEILRDYRPLNIYTECFNEIAEKNSIPRETHEVLRDYLESAALFYIAFCQSKRLRPQIGNAASYFNKVGKKARELEILLDPERETIQQVIHYSSLFENDTKNTSELISSSIEKLKQLQNLNSVFLRSPLVKISKYGKKAPIGYSGLQEWVRLIFLIWTGTLNRTIENPNDGVNGRIHLLNFMYDCREPLHPLLEFDTLDSMLRKVQKSMEIR